MGSLLFYTLSSRIMVQLLCRIMIQYQEEIIKFKIEFKMCYHKQSDLPKQPTCNWHYSFVIFPQFAILLLDGNNNS